MRHYDLVVVGGGSAGMGAALEAYKNGIKGENILILEKAAKLGGILNQCIHTGFGLEEFKEQLTGPEYADRFINQLKETSIEVRVGTIVLKITRDRKVTVSTFGKTETFSFTALIYAAGCFERGAGNIKLPGDRCSGILTAGQAQNYLNNMGYLPGKNVFILGSGDIGLIMARRMTLEGAKVLGVAELMPYSNGLKRNIVQCLDDYDIPLYLSTTVTKTIGKNRLEKIEICSVDSSLKPIKETARIIECDTLLLSVGLIPYIILLEPLFLKKDSKDRIMVNEKCETSMEGLYIVGNSLHVHDLVDNVTKESRIAGKFASEYIKNGNKESKYLDVIYDQNISYVVPNIVSKDAKEINIKFRVKNIINNPTIVISDENKVLKKMKHLILIPSEMVSINLKNIEDLQGFLKVEVLYDGK